MCPACIGSAWLLLTGAGSAGGLAAFVAARVLRENQAASPPPESVKPRVADPPAT